MGFEDVNFMNFAKHRSSELNKLVEKFHPDIIMGDFNAIHPTTADPDFLRSFKNYPQSSPYGNMDHEQQKLFRDYMKNGHNALERLGYTKAYSANIVGKTSKFHDLAIDWCYYKPDGKISVKGMEKIDMITDNLTDHNAVVVEFSGLMLKGSFNPEPLRGERLLVLKDIKLRGGIVIKKGDMVTHVFTRIWGRQQKEYNVKSNKYHGGRRPFSLEPEYLLLSGNAPPSPETHPKKQKTIKKKDPKTSVTAFEIEDPPKTTHSRCAVM